MKTKRDDNGQYLIWCDGCRAIHAFDSRWTFNGNFERPSFTPSLHCRTGHYVDHANPCYLCAEIAGACGVCHSFVTDGRIQFLGDCTHSLANQTIDLREVEAWPR